MPHSRTIETLSLSELGFPCSNFTRLTGIDPLSQDPRFHEEIIMARSLVEDHCKIGIVHAHTAIASSAENHVLLQTGHELVGTLIPQVLDDAQQVFLFVASVCGFDTCQTGDMMLDYFIDVWASAYAERAQSYFADMVERAALSQGLRRTHLWCPGQHSFDLSNQAALFDILKPGDIGCTLTSRFMMKPVKSTSGVIGTVPKDSRPLIKPCDYCAAHGNCRSKQGGCPVL